jgi:hypothetical protein
LGRRQEKWTVADEPGVILPGIPLQCRRFERQRGDYLPKAMRSMSPDPFLSLEVFYGQANPGECRLYARLAGLDVRDGWRLSGRVRGPECRFAQTLPADYPLQSREPGAGASSESLLAEAFIPDPCFWSPGLPQVYAATVDLVQNGAIRGSVTRMVGVRPLGARGRNLFWEGKRWVLRGVLADEVAASGPASLSDWHEGPTAMLIDHPPDELCQQASTDGVLIVARIAGPQSRLAMELARLARWPSVGIAIVRSAGVDLSELRNVARNILLVTPISLGNQWKAELPLAGAQAVTVDLSPAAANGASSSNLAVALRDCTAPLIACRPAGAQNSVVAARAECDRLQADLAAIGDFAGYIV